MRAVDEKLTINKLGPNVSSTSPEIRLHDLGAFLCVCVSLILWYSRASIIRTSFIRNLDYPNLNLHLLMRFMNNFNEIH